jgi:putative transposase
MSYEFAEGYKIRDQSATHFLTFSIMGWIDIFSRQRYRDLMLESFQFCRENKGLKIGAYVIMSNHIHTIWTATNNNLSDIIRDFKTFTSKAITRAIEKEIESRRDWLLYMFRFYANRTAANDYFKVWTNNNHPEEIHSESFLRTKLNYTHENPVRAGLVTEPLHYLYSSAANYEGKKGLMEIDLLF